MPTVGVSLEEIARDTDGPLDRVRMEREFDVTPTLIRILLFAPPAK
jgi:hypothetical protein